MGLQEITSWQSRAGNHELGTTDREPQAGNHWRLLNFPIWHHPMEILHAAASAAVPEGTSKAGLPDRLTGKTYRAGQTTDHGLRATDYGLQNRLTEPAFSDTEAAAMGRRMRGCFILSHLYTIEKHQIETTSESLYFVFNYLLIQYKVLFNSL